MEAPCRVRSVKTIGRAKSPSDPCCHFVAGCQLSGCSSGGSPAARGCIEEELCLADSAPNVRADGGIGRVEEVVNGSGETEGLLMSPADAAVSLRTLVRGAVT